MNSRNRITRKSFIQKGSAAIIGLPLISATHNACAEKKESPTAQQKLVTPEWRNRQPGMTYRQLGRTGLMVSEIVNGGNNVNTKNLRTVEIAIERGLNYLDTSPNYGRGESETAIGKLLSGSVVRDKIFITTKISKFNDYRNNLYKEIFDGLPSGKKEAILKKAVEMRNERGVDRPEYFLTYWPGHPKQMDGAFLCNAMMDEYGEKVEGSSGFEKVITESLEGSLKRMNTDHVDIMMCPHATSVIEEASNPFIIRTFEKLRQQGKARFLGLSTHNDMNAILRKADETGYYDVVMLAYNVINHGFLDEAIKEASGRGMGLIAMKAAMAVYTNHEALKPIPQWRIDKLNHIIPGDMKVPVKGYLWALQNQYLSAVIADMPTEEMMNDNLSLAGKRVELQPA